MLTIALIVLGLIAGFVLAIWIASGRREVLFLDSDGFPQRGIPED